MKITTKEITDFSKKNLKEIVKDSKQNFNLLKKGDLLSLFNFFCSLTTDPKQDIFVTDCPLLLKNRENIEKNYSIKIMTLQELGDGR